MLAQRRLLPGHDRLSPRSTKSISLLTLVAILTLIWIGFSAVDVHAAATIATDQSDYVTGSTVTIYGSGFLFVHSVSLDVIDPLGNVTTWSVTLDSSGSFKTSYLLDHVIGNYAVTATDGTNSASTTFHDASEAANLDQCRNDGVGVTPVPCNPNTLPPLGWVNGDAQGVQAHWMEGQFIAYRVIFTGLSVGAHTLDFHFDNVHDGKHAIDYVGSVNATETFSSTPTMLNADNNNPCSDVLLASQCVPANPAGFIAVPSASLANCDGSLGTFSGSQTPGKIFIYGPTGTTLNSFTYTAQNVVIGTGICRTNVELSFNAGGTSVVIAWGGHLASQANWGRGNSAIFINGSPYHMILDLLDGANTGAQDRALTPITSAIFFLPSTMTTVITDSNGLPVISTIPLGSSAHDNASLSGAATNAGGNITYRFYTNGLCSGAPSTSQMVTVTNAVIPPSSSTGPLATGTYSYNATYSGDSIDFPQLPNSACEPFTVNKAPTTTTTAIFNSTGTSVLGSTVPLGTSVHDLATVTGAPHPFTITGTVTYNFFTNIGCSGAPSMTFGPLAVGSASPNVGPLSAGFYSFNATYSGDSNYNVSTSACEFFAVAKNNSSTTTTVTDDTTVSTVPPGGIVSLGDTVHDSASVVGVPSTPFPITGRILYQLSSNGCTGPFVNFGSVVPVGANSSSTVPLTPGNYAFRADYSGDTNYSGSLSGCELFAVPKQNTTINTVVVQSTGAPLPTPVPLGDSVNDTATVGTQVNGFVIGGSLTFSFFSNGACSGISSALNQTVTMSGGLVPNSSKHGPLAAGSYSFEATYSGDSNYNGSVSSCEPFTVASGTIGGTIVPVDKLGLLVPYIGLFSIFIALAIVGIHVRRVRNRKEGSAPV